MKPRVVDFERLNFTQAPKITTLPPGPRATEILERQRRVDSRALAYPNAVPLAPAKGLGATVMDADGNYYIDFFSGLGALNIGHSNPEVVAAIKEQSEMMTHCLDLPGSPRVQISEKLRDLAPGEMRNRCRIFLSSPSGSEAVEAAVKLAKYHTKKPGVISFEGGWHGTTGASLAVTGKRAIRTGFLPIMPEVTIIPYAHCYRCQFGLTHPSCHLQCAKYLEHIVKDPDSGATDPGCVLLEAIQGEAGFIVPPDGYLQEVRRICTRHGLILIVDEVLTGFGRTGAMFACEHWGVTPDILCMAKTMGGGLPLAGLIIREEFDTWPAGAHVGTFRGNLLSSAAGLATLNFIEEAQLAQRSLDLGRRALRQLRELAGGSRFLGDVRGIGLGIGLEFVKDRESNEPAPEVVPEVVRKCFERGLILFAGGRWKNVVRIMPPLVITEKLLDRGIDIFAEVLSSVEKK